MNRNSHQFIFQTPGRLIFLFGSYTVSGRWRHVYQGQPRPAYFPVILPFVRLTSFSNSYAAGLICSGTPVTQSSLRVKAGQRTRVKAATTHSGRCDSCLPLCTSPCLSLGLVPLRELGGGGWGDLIRVTASTWSFSLNVAATAFGTCLPAPPRHRIFTLLALAWSLAQFRTFQHLTHVPTFSHWHDMTCC